MGIKFRCPNGHKLNVKTHQAGKKGYCPKCKSQVDIPLKSTRKGKAEREAARQAAQAQATNPSETVSAGATTTTPPAAMPVATRIAPLAEVPTASLPTTPAAVASDPLAVNPSLVWYVRSTSGNQFGPAKGELFKSWIQEGRVGPDSLVWQEGWDDWKQGAEIFPQLAGPSEPGTGLSSPGGLNDFTSLNIGDANPTGTTSQDNSTTRRFSSRR
ncbi:MAG TPA: DUF4339 domain-containing protein, partial [Planctomycetaceae bacterium]|nr:DUF4339 domain-containing protein [Planctomycetaceae bacterium]